jgi:hypothetical protein
MQFAAFVIRHSSFVIRPGNKKPRRSIIAWGRMVSDHARFHPSYRDCRFQISDFGLRCLLNLQSAICNLQCQRSLEKTQLHSAFPRRLAAGLH